LIFCDLPVIFKQIHKVLVLIKKLFFFSEHFLSGFCSLCKSMRVFLSTLYLFSDFNNQLRTAAGFYSNKDSGTSDKNGVPWSPVESRGVPWSPVESRGAPWSPVESWSPGVCCFPLDFLSFFILVSQFFYMQSPDECFIISINNTKRVGKSNICIYYLLFNKNKLIY
jgi:hypothetical protein